MYPRLVFLFVLFLFICIMFQLMPLKSNKLLEVVLKLQDFCLVFISFNYIDF